MLKKRIIACLDIHDGLVVKGTKFQNLEVIGDPIELALKYELQGVDELVLLDISATIEGRKNLSSLVKSIAERICIPCTVGGGIRTLDDIALLLASGADKVSLGSIAVENPDFVRAAADCFGTQCIVISLDVTQNSDGQYVPTARSGTIQSSLSLLDFLRILEVHGAGELLVNAVHRDGTGEGYDLELLQYIKSNTQLPVIASSGAKTSEDFLDAFQCAAVDAVLAAGVFHRNEIKIPDLKQFLLSHDILCRP